MWLDLNKVEGVEGEPKMGAEIPPFLITTIEAFGDVFAKPEGLPPPRGHEHAIVLKEGSNPIGVRPYLLSTISER